MKTAILLLSSIFLLSLNKESTSEVDIFEAIEKDLINFSAKSNGGYSAESIVVDVENLGNLKSIVVPAGTRFLSEYDHEQDLITTEDEIIVLNRHSPTNEILSGYCVQKFNSAPSDGARFLIEREKNENIRKLVDYIESKNIDEQIKQTAIWSVSDRTNVSGIYKEGDEQIDKLRAYICSLTGQENVWYNTNPSYSVDEDRNIVQETTEVQGLINYEVKKTGKIKMLICKENGEVIRTLGGSMSVDHLGDFQFNFKVKVKGWDAGEYSVKIQIDDTPIHNEKFEIG
ncbi:MAG: hypothetical protein WED10_09965 [Brumimicrobium sp.]